MQIAKKVLDLVLGVGLTLAQREKVGRHVLYRASGRGNSDPASNGENWLLDRLRSSLPDFGPVVVDVGANIGEWLAEAARRLHPTASFVAFEPNPVAWRRLSSGIAGSAFASRAECIQGALGDHDGSGVLFNLGTASGTASLHRRNSASSGVISTQSEEVKVYAGDSFFEARSIARIDFLKIDAEGHELAILRGFSRMLNEGRISCLQFEYGGTWIDARVFLADAFALLESNGYSVGRLHPSWVGFGVPYLQRDEDFVYANYVAIRKDLRDAWF